MKKWRERRRLIKSIKCLVNDSRVTERRIADLFGKLLTNTRIKDIPQDQMVMSEASDFIKGLRAAQDRLERIALGEPPWERLRFSREASYWESTKPKPLELDLRLGKWLWERQSRRWIRKQERKRFCRPACRRFSIGTITRLERALMSFRQQQLAMLDNIAYLPYSFPLLDALKVVQAIEDDEPVRETIWHTVLDERNRSIQQARIELKMAEDHIYIFNEVDLPMCLEGTDITRRWRKRCKEARIMALLPEWEEYVAYCNLIVDDIQNAFQYRTILHRAEARLIDTVQSTKLLKSRYGKNFRPPRIELKHIDRLLSSEAPSAWRDNDWERLSLINRQQAQKLAEFCESLRAWIRVNHIPIDEELALALKPLPSLEPIERVRNPREGYVEAGNLGTLIDPSYKEAWEND